MDEPPLVPPSFFAQPRWQDGYGGGVDVQDGEWLARLGVLAHEQCSRWALAVDGPTMHGSNGVAIPVRRGTDHLVLKLTPPDSRFYDEVRALRFWNGRGTVLLMDVDPDAGALLLERLDASRSLATMPLPVALPILARTMPRLTVADVPLDVPSTAAVAASRGAEMPGQWRRLGEPFDRGILETAVSAARLLAASDMASASAVNGDLHADQVLAGEREPWLTVDPVLLRGDAEYDLARMLWTRLGEMADDAQIRRNLDLVVDAAELDPERALAWALFRTVDYWLWGLDNGLTEDPVRCDRLFAALAARPTPS